MTTRKKCEACHRKYTKEQIDDILAAMFGSFVDEDYLILIYGLCPGCWPQYN